MKKIILITLLFCSTSFAQVTKQKTLKELKNDLDKIELAIETTREKMNEIKDARFLPDLYFMLAELHVDKAKYMLVIKQLENKKTPIDELDFTAEKKPKFQAIEIYKTILEKFPNLQGRDRALFFIAHEYRELGQLEDMVKTYQQLTSKFPNSPYWSESMLVVGDYFFENKKDFEYAMDMYNKILSKPPGPYTPLARYKLGWCYINLEKFKEALLTFEKVLSVDSKIDLSQLPEFYKKTDVRREALLAMVRPYSELEPKEMAKFGEYRVNAIQYFYNLSNNVASYRQVLNRLAVRMIIKNRFIGATRIYFEYLRIATDLEERLEAIEKLYEAMKNSAKDWPVHGYTLEIIKTLKQLESSTSIDAKEKVKYNKNFEIFARDAATRAQKRAKETNNKNDFKQAILAYESYLSYFSSSKFSNTIRLNLAESYFNTGELVKAALEYERLVSDLKDTKNIKKFLDSSLQAFITTLKNPALLTRVQLVQSRYGLRDVGNKFLKAYPNDSAGPTLRFAIARTYYDERDFDNAVKAYKEFLAKHPKHSEAETAANLILDAFNQREDYEGLVREGKLIAANANLDSKIRSDVAEIVKQAQYKKLQADAGDYSSPAYAKNLMKFAEKYKGSALGDQALFEAFTAFKAKKDPKAYDAGEALLLKHGDSKYAKAVVSEMGKMALVTADFRRAANYFESYSQKYPLDNESKNLMRSAANMRENMGDYDEAKKNYNFIGDRQKASEMDYLAGNWAALEKSASGLGPSIYGNYYSGLAKYRRGDFASAKPYFQQASRQGGGSFEQQSMAAHSLYLLSADALRSFKRVQMQAGNEAQSIQIKNQQLSGLTNQLNTVIKFGNGKWTIASLYALGQSNVEFANFIKNAPIPNGLSGAQVQQYKSALAQQAQQYDVAANNYFKQCVQNAEKFEVFTSFVKGCLSKGEVEVDEERDAFKPPKASNSSPVSADKIRIKLYDDSRNAKLLMSLALEYTKNRDYAMSNLILSRAYEINTKDSNLISLQGVNHLFMNNSEDAKASFDRALKQNSRDGYALKGKAALYKQFNFSNKLRSVQGAAKSASTSSEWLHPWMSSL
jgi:cellulose synthase operon protein C